MVKLDFACFKASLLTALIVGLDVSPLYGWIGLPAIVIRYPLDVVGLGEFIATALLFIMFFKSRKHLWISAGAGGAFLVGLSFIVVKLI